MEVRVKRIANPQSDLVHSDSFLGMEFSDELYHWKYIKREKKNGKWRYYYDKNSASSDIKTKRDKYDSVSKKYIGLSPEGEETILTENIITENIIKEDIIVENIIKEDVITEDVIKEINVKEIKITGSSAATEWIRDNSTLKAKVAKLDKDFTEDIASGEKWIYDNVLDTKFGDLSANIIGRVGEKVTSLLKSLRKKK